MPLYLVEWFLTCLLNDLKLLKTKCFSVWSVSGIAHVFIHTFCCHCSIPFTEYLGKTHHMTGTAPLHRGHTADVQQKFDKHSRIMTRVSTSRMEKIPRLFPRKIIQIIGTETCRKQKNRTSPTSKNNHITNCQKKTHQFSPMRQIPRFFPDFSPNFCNPCDPLLIRQCCPAYRTQYCSPSYQYTSLRSSTNSTHTVSIPRTQCTKPS